MILFLTEDENIKLKGKKVIVPKNVGAKIKSVLNKTEKIPNIAKSKGYKRAMTLSSPDNYNKRKDDVNSTKDGSKIISFGDLKKISQRMNEIPTNDTEYNLLGGNTTKSWANQTLSLIRNSVKNVNGVPQVPKPSQVAKTKTVKPETIDKIITNEIRKHKSSMILESQESKSISQAKRLVMDRLGYSEEQADEFVRINVRNIITPLKEPKCAKFILGATRMLLDRELTSATKISEFNTTLELISSDEYVNKYDRNLNGLSAQDLINEYSETVEGNIQKNKGEISQMSFTKSDYKIVRIDSFQQAAKYSKYVEWCITERENMYNNYTSNGTNQFYFCLKPNFKRIKKTVGENCPLDEYGLSMFAVSVNEKGNLNTCTCRWNHDKGGNDKIMDVKQISTVIGMNFYDVFKPNNKWAKILHITKQRLASDERLEDIFTDVIYDEDTNMNIVCLINRWNIVDANRNLLLNTWYDSINCSSGGYFIVKYNGKSNFIRKDGTLISDVWYKYARSFSDGFGIVYNNEEKGNYINGEGKLLLKDWLDLLYGFSDGYAVVGFYKNEEALYGIIDKKGNFVVKPMFEYIGQRHEREYNIVKKNGKYNVLKDNKELISDIWFDYIMPFPLSKNESDDMTYTIVELSFGSARKYNFMNKNGKLLSDTWFDNALSFKGYNYADVFLNNKWYYLDKEGKLHNR